MFLDLEKILISLFKEKFLNLKNAAKKLLICDYIELLFLKSFSI
jgi:hypothetical protein